MTKDDRRRTVVWGALGAYAMAILVGIAWWTVNLTAIPEYGDTREYIELARTFDVDQYRTVLFPAVLRLTQEAAGVTGIPFQTLLYVLQTAVALGAAAYLFATLWRVAARNPRRTWLAEAPTRLRRSVVALAAAGLFTTPLVNHYALSVLSDSLATSLTVFAVASLIRVAVLRDHRVVTSATLIVSATAAALTRTEKIYVVGLLVLVSMIVIARGWRVSRRVLATLSLALVVPAVLASSVNRATQTADSGRPAPTLTMAAFDRTVWPRMEKALPFVSPEARELVTVEQARAFDAMGQTVPPMVSRLRAFDEGGDRYVNEFTRAALRCCWVPILGRAAFDFAKYAAAALTYPAELLFGADAPTAWTHSRMSGAHPVATRAHVGTSFVLLVAVQVPLLVAAVRRRPWAMSAALAIMAGAILVNAAFFTLVTGLNANIRYGLLGYELLYSTMIWLNVGALLGRTSVGDGAPQAPGELSPLAAGAV